MQINLYFSLSEVLKAGILKRTDLERIAKNVREELFRLLRFGAVVAMNIPSEMYYE